MVLREDILSLEGIWKIYLLYCFEYIDRVYSGEPSDVGDGQVVLREHI